MLSRVQRQGKAQFVPDSRYEHMFDPVIAAAFLGELCGHVHGPSEVVPIVSQWVALKAGRTSQVGVCAAREVVRCRTLPVPHFSTFNSGP
jgi:hypothetical protein